MSTQNKQKYRFGHRDGVVFTFTGADTVMHIHWRWDARQRTAIPPPDRCRVCCESECSVGREGRRKRSWQGASGAGLPDFKLIWFWWHLITLPIIGNQNQYEVLHTHTHTHTNTHTRISKGIHSGGGAVRLIIKQENRKSPKIIKHLYMHHVLQDHLFNSLVLVNE